MPKSNGNKIGFHEQLKQEIPYLRRYARSIAGSGNLDLADDLVQDCLERALRRSQQFQAGTNLRAWLSTILKNAHIDYRRRMKRAGVTLPVEDVALAAPAPQPSHLRLLRTLEAADHLRPCDRRLLWLVAVEGLPYGQVADRFGIAEGTVKSRIFRARRLLQAT